MIGEQIAHTTPDDMAWMLTHGILRPLFLGAFTGVAPVGSGVNTITWDSIAVQTGVTANSSAGAYFNLRGLTRDDYYSKIDFGKRLVLNLEFNRGGADVQVASRFHIKAGSSIADLSSAGIGIKALNWSLYGDSFGSAGALVNLNYNVLTIRDVLVTIKHYPGYAVEWWINGDLKGVQTDTTKISSGHVSSPLALFSVANGVTGGVNASAMITGGWIWQEL